MNEYNPTVEELEAKIAALEAEFKVKGCVPHCIRCDARTDDYAILICDECVAESRAARVRRQAKLN